MDVLRMKEIRILRNKYPHAEEIFGPNHNLPDINAVVTDIVEVACSMLVERLRGVFFPRLDYVSFLWNRW